MFSDSPVTNKNRLKKSVFYSFLSPYIRENRILMYFLEDRGLSDPVDDRVRNWTFKYHQGSDPVLSSVTWTLPRPPPVWLGWHRFAPCRCRHCIFQWLQKYIPTLVSYTWSCPVPTRLGPGPLPICTRSTQSCS